MDSLNFHKISVRRRSGRQPWADLLCGAWAAPLYLPPLWSADKRFLSEGRRELSDGKPGRSAGGRGDFTHPEQASLPRVSEL